MLVLALIQLVHTVDIPTKRGLNQDFINLKEMVEMINLKHEEKEKALEPRTS